MSFKSTAMAGQDTFAFEVCGRKAEGRVLDIGSYNVCWCNNSYGLERIGWDALMVDLFRDEENLPKRKGTFIQGDATKLDWARILGTPSYWDYLSLDVDDATLDTLKALPLEQVRFGCITLEHDAYRLGNGPRDEMRKILAEHGYDLVCADVMIAYPEGKISAYEDWWCGADLLGEADQFRSEGKLWNEILKDVL